ncbi:MAG: LysM domain [Actinomycetota bacterium]|jgi:LysM repeat protein
MDPRTRQELTRYGAPAAFLAAVTIAVILINSGLNSGPGSTTTVGVLPTTTRVATTSTTTKLVLTTPQAATTPTTETTAPGAEYYTVRSGDTLGSIAEKYSATVDELMTLNPGIDPTALHIGDKLRVK